MYSWFQLYPILLALKVSSLERHQYMLLHHTLFCNFTWNAPREGEADFFYLRIAILTVASH